MTGNHDKQIHVKMPYDLHKELRVQAAVRETTIQEYVVRAIKGQLTKDSKGKEVSDVRK
jgi:hypothetical protein